MVVDSSLRAAWSRASDLAARTPKARNRYVDLLRAASILVVVIGHWLMAAPSVERGEFSLSDMLQIAPWTQWLTWVFQVMPLFFIVGGYANAASWERARRSRSPSAPLGRHRLSLLACACGPCWTKIDARTNRSVSACTQTGWMRMIVAAVCGGTAAPK